MKTRRFKLIIILTTVILLFTQCNWVKQAGNITGADNGFQIVTDSLDNCYVTGNFTGKAVFGDTTITSVDTEDCYIAKYDKNGNFIWVKSFGGEGSQCGNSLAIQPNGDILLAGNFENELLINDTIIKYGWSNSVFIVKLNDLGQIKWYKTYGNGEFNDISEIKSDNENNIIAVGRLSDTISIGNKSMISHGKVDGFILKLSNNGNFIWSHVLGGKDDDEINKVSIDMQNNIYIAGESENDYSINTISNDNDSIISTNSNISYIAKYSKNGSLLNFKKYGEGNFVETLDIKNDNNKGIYITGFHCGPLSINKKEFPYSTSRDFDMFIAKFDDNFDFIWFNQFYSSCNSYGHSINFDKNNNCYLTGNFCKEIQINGKKIETTGESNAIIFKFNTDGKILKYKIFSGTGNVTFWNTYISKTSDNIFSTGSFTKCFELNKNNKVNSDKDKDILIVKLSNDFWNF